MSTHADRLRAVRELAKSTGRPVAAVLKAVAASWDLSAFEHAQLVQELQQQQPPTRDPAVTREAQRLASEAQAQARTADVLAFREYQQIRSANPFKAARFRLDNLAAIDRGQALDTPDSEPPPTAA